MSSLIFRRQLHSSSCTLARSVPSKAHHHQPIPDTAFPHGYLTTGLHSGVKKSKPGVPDLGVIVSTSSRTSSAACFTRNVFKAAPVQVSTNVLKKTGGRAGKLVVNSGGANAVTGKKGLEDAWAMARTTDEAFAALVDGGEQNVPAEGSAKTLVMSTGVIGQLLPIDDVVSGIKSAAESLTQSPADSTSTSKALHSGFADWERAARAFMTTDTFPKLRARSFTLSAANSPSGVEETYRIAGIDKGAGMIHPNMGPPHATLLGLLATDAPVSPRSLQTALTYAVDRSFNSISVDGDSSTNDTIIAFANGAAAAEPGTGAEIDEQSHPEAYLAFRDELTSFAIDLAKLVVRDGEGATKFVTVTVKVCDISVDSLHCTCSWRNLRR